MLPKIVTGWQSDLEEFLLNFGLSRSSVLSINCDKLLIDDFREWLNFCGNLTRSDDKYVLLLENADLLSAEAQNILLKPLEEKRDTVQMYLLVKSENKVLPTILSRCEMLATKKLVKNAKYWLSLVKLWKSQPADIIGFCEIFPVEDLSVFMSEIVSRMKLEISKEATVKRIEIINCFLQATQESAIGNANKRLVLENLLLKTWRLIRTQHKLGGLA